MSLSLYLFVPRYLCFLFVSFYLPTYLPTCYISFFIHVTISRFFSIQGPYHLFLSFLSVHVFCVPKFRCLSSYVFAPVFLLSIYQSNTLIYLCSSVSLSIGSGCVSLCLSCSHTYDLRSTILSSTFLPIFIYFYANAFFSPTRNKIIFV